MMKAMTLLNQKGGVGKSTLSVHIAGGMALNGKRVVVLDADPQGHAAALLNQQESPGLYNLLIRNMEWEDVLVPIPTHVYDPSAAEPDEKLTNVKTRNAEGGELYLLPGNVETRAIGAVNPNPFLLREKLREIADWADVVVIDTSPTPSQFHTTIYMASDSILFPVQPAYLSLDGLAKSLITQEMARLEREGMGEGSISRMGIIPTMFRGNTKAHDLALQNLLKDYRQLVWPAVPLRTLWEQAAFVGQLMYRYGPRSKDPAEGNEIIGELRALVERVEISLGMERKVNV
jgi:chromosome partitioning protein